MGAQVLSSRAIIGTYYRVLNALDGMEWIGDISNIFNSNQEIETYPWLGQSPAMREWVGGRQSRGFASNDLQIANKHFEATLEVLVRDLRRDKSGQVLVRISELARRTNSHWASLLSALVATGTAAGTCYDGQAFFSAAHEEGASGAQSNLLSATIVDEDAPTVVDLQEAVGGAVQAIVGVVDDQGEPMNEDASSFRVLCPVNMMRNMAQALQTPLQVSDTQSALVALQQDFTVNMSVNARLTDKTQFQVYRTDGMIKPLIRQQETDVNLKAKAEGSEFEFDNDAHQYGVDAWRNVGFGQWQGAALVDFSE